MKNKNFYYIQIIELIEKNLLGRKRSTKSALKYFRSDSVSLELCYKLIKNYYMGKPTNFEELYKEMTLGSRQTIKTIIDNAIAEKFLYVHKNKSDLVIRVRSCAKLGKVRCSAPLFVVGMEVVSNAVGRSDQTCNHMSLAVIK